MSTVNDYKNEQEKYLCLNLYCKKNFLFKCFVGIEIFVGILKIHMGV